MPENFVVPNPQFASVFLYTNVGNSTYHALAAKLEKRFSNGLSFSFAYTFSKLIDDASSYFSQTIFTSARNAADLSVRSGNGGLRKTFTGSCGGSHRSAQR